MYWQANANTPPSVTPPFKCALKLQRVFTLGDGCWLPTKTCAVRPAFVRIIGEGSGGSRSKNVLEGAMTTQMLVQGHNLKLLDEAWEVGHQKRSRPSGKSGSHPQKINLEIKTHKHYHDGVVRHDFLGDFVDVFFSPIRNDPKRNT